MAKRNCRRTNGETAIHNKAVKIRKMTDEQLVHYVEDRVEKARSEGFNQGKKKCVERLGDDHVLKSFIQAIGHLPGIGKATMWKIITLAEEGGYIE